MSARSSTVDLTTTQFAPRRSATIEISGGDPEYRTVAFTVSSDVGFADTIRFDPVFSPQVADLQDLEISVSLVRRRSEEWQRTAEPGW